MESGGVDRNHIKGLAMATVSGLLLSIYTKISKMASQIQNEVLQSLYTNLFIAMMTPLLFLARSTKKHTSGFG
jgi:ferric iron reductase protein FhuF